MGRFEKFRAGDLSLEDRDGRGRLTTFRDGWRRWVEGIGRCQPKSIHKRNCWRARRWLRNRSSGMWWKLKRQKTQWVGAARVYRTSPILCNLLISGSVRLFICVTKAVLFWNVLRRSAKNGFSTTIGGVQINGWTTTKLLCTSRSTNKRPWRLFGLWITRKNAPKIAPELPRFGQQKICSRNLDGLTARFTDDNKSWLSWDMQLSTVLNTRQTFLLQTITFPRMSTFFCARDASEMKAMQKGTRRSRRLEKFRLLCRWSVSRWQKYVDLWVVVSIEMLSFGASYGFLK